MPEKTITVELTLSSAAKVAEVMEEIRSGADAETAELCAEVVAAVDKAVWEPDPSTQPEQPRCGGSGFLFSTETPTETIREGKCQGCDACQPEQEETPDE